MRKTRGFRLGRKLIRVFKWVIKPKPKPTAYHRLSAPDYKTTTMTKICNWGRCLKRGAKELCFSKSTSGYSPVGQDPFEPKSVEVPKGHLAVYVGQKDDDPHRFLVPVIYFNHPLFGELLREAEEEYGFEHSGGITLPCPLSEFENVQTRIAAGRKTTLKRRMR